jgi:opacity protein-like surface antigen
MTLKKFVAASGLALALLSSTASAGIVDPDCTAEKAAKGAAAKATVGVGGRCDAKEAAKDSGKKAVGVEDKGPIEQKKSNNDTPAEKAKDAAQKATQ